MTLDLPVLKTDWPVLALLDLRAMQVEFLCILGSGPWGMCHLSPDTRWPVSGFRGSSHHVEIVAGCWDMRNA